MPAFQDPSAVPSNPSKRLGLPLRAALFALSVVGCMPDEEGVAPPPGKLNYPVGMALDPSGDRLFVASSDFDLRFNGGVIQVLDAEEIRSYLPRSCAGDSECPAGWSCPSSDGVGSTLCVDASGSICGELGELSPEQRAKHPGACNPLPLERDGLILDAARIAPFVADVKYIPASGSRSARVVMPVRGDATLHWADVKSSPDDAGRELDCGQGADFGECDATHRRGDGSDERAPDGTQLPTEPFGLAASADGSTVFVGHQSQGKISVFANTAKGPELQTVLDGLPSNPMGLAVVPPPRAAAAMGIDYTLGLLVTFRYPSGSIPNLELLRYYDEAAAAPAVPYLSRVGAATITISNNGLDSRGLALDSSQRSACESDCDVGRCSAPEAEACRTCLIECATLPLDVYVANRAPHQLLIGHTGAADGALGRSDLPDFSDSAPLRGGPSRVVLANVLGTSGELEPRVFVMAFNSQLLYVFDPVARRVEAHVETGPGPQALVVDEQRALGYLAHFTDSYLSVIDLDRRHSSYGRVLLNVGVPEAPRSSK
jgi:DNA-binding beta-propeller fold protein YncE